MSCPIIDMDTLVEDTLLQDPFPLQIIEDKSPSPAYLPYMVEPRPIGSGPWKLMVHPILFDDTMPPLPEGFVALFDISSRIFKGHMSHLLGGAITDEQMACDFWLEVLRPAWTASSILEDYSTEDLTNLSKEELAQVFERLKSNRKLEDDLLGTCLAVRGLWPPATGAETLDKATLHSRGGGSVDLATFTYTIPQLVKINISFPIKLHIYGYTVELLVEGKGERLGGTSSQAVLQLLEHLLSLEQEGTRYALSFRGARFFRMTRGRGDVLWVDHAETRRKYEAWLLVSHECEALGIAPPLFEQPELDFSDWVDYLTRVEGLAPGHEDYMSVFPEDRRSSTSPYTTSEHYRTYLPQYLAEAVRHSIHIVKAANHPRNLTKDGYASNNSVNSPDTNSHPGMLMVKGVKLEALAFVKVELSKIPAQELAKGKQPEFDEEDYAPPAGPYDKIATRRRQAQPENLSESTSRFQDGVSGIDNSTVGILPRREVIEKYGWTAEKIALVYDGPGPELDGNKILTECYTVHLVC